jgi:hypothetical protein
VVLFAIVWTLWSVALAFVTLPLYNWAVPGGGASLGFGIEIQSWWATLLACLAGIALLSIVPTAVNGLGLLDVVIAQRLLGPGGRLAARVGELEPAGRGSSMRQRKNGGGSNAICTTVHSNGWSLWL